MDRRLFIVIAVLGFHVLGLWALQTGLLRRAVELVVPVQVMAEFIEPPQPQVTPEPPQARAQPVQQTVAPRQTAPKPAPQPVAIADKTPAPGAPSGITTPQPPAPPMPAPEPAAEPAPPVPPRIELPSSDAGYLNNPAPRYPPLSKRLGEQGRVVVRVLIEANGTASQAEVRTSSGYERLDQAALQTALSWRYVPGKNAGVPVTMWHTMPISFVLE